MKMRKILAASTAALLAFGTSAVVASAAFDADDDTAYEEITKESIDVDATALNCTDITKTAGELSVSASVASKDVSKFKGYYLQVDFENPDDDEATPAMVDGAAFTDLTAKQQTEVSKCKKTDTVVLKVALAKEKNSDGDLKSESKAPAPITFEISGLSEDVHVYHLGKKTIEEVEVKMDATIGAGKTATFTAQNFSDYLITKTELKKGVTSADDADESDASAADSTTSSGSTSTNPETGIALAIAPVVLAAGAVAVVALKKKH